MDKAQAIHSFWSSFDLTAYDENTVPDDAVTPYITYEVITDSIDNIVSLGGSVWYRSTSWEEASKKADEISARLGVGGVIIPLDTGYAWLYRGTPFSQRLSDEDDQIRRIYFNLTVEYLTDK